MGLDIFFAKRNKKNTEDIKELAYFRKVNFLVAFFCKRNFDLEGQTPLPLSREDITDLKEACENVLLYVDHEYGDDEELTDKLREIAEEKLPTMSGFFFGSTNYDGEYLSDVEEVRDTCNELLEVYDSLGEDEEIAFATWY